MPCDRRVSYSIRNTGEKHKAQGQVTFIITPTAERHQRCTDPGLLLEKLKSRIEQTAKASFDAWTVQVDDGSYEPYKKD